MNTSSHRNNTGILLIVIGGITVIVGAILWVVGTNQLNYDTGVNGYSQILSGMDTANTAGDWWMIGWGIGLVVIGVLCLIGAAITYGLARQLQAAHQ